MLHPPAGQDRRAVPRYSCVLNCSCQPLPLGRRWPGWAARVRDISSHGLGLVLDRPLDPGTFLSILLGRPGADWARLLQVRVMRHAVQLDDGTWEIGCAWAGQLSREELQSLL